MTTPDFSALTTGIPVKKLNTVITISRSSYEPDSSAYGTYDVNEIAKMTKAEIEDDPYEIINTFLENDDVTVTAEVTVVETPGS